MINKSYFEKLNRFMKVAYAIIFIMLLILPNFSFINHKIVHAEESTSNVIILDLRRGNVTIKSSTYSGYKVVYNEADGTYTGASVTNEYWAPGTNSFRIIQTKENEKIDYGRVVVDEQLIDFTYVKAYEQEWQKLATNDGRVVTNNRIDIINGDYDVDITLENIWSNFGYGSVDGGGSGTTKGSINIECSGGDKGLDVTLKLKGDNRLQAIRYFTTSNATNTHLVFTSYLGDKSEEGTLVVASDQTKFYSHNGNYKNENGATGQQPANHWNSVIGGNDSTGHARGIIFNGGTVYAGSSKWENCTAIGAGGNDIGEVTINGGKVTAISSSTGTAIGGGIAHTGTGGQGFVTINGGITRAYNFGQPFAETLSDTGQNGMKSTTGEYAIFVPGTAIGGAGSAYQSGSKGTVKITGGTVYAESLGGSGIGGGNTIHKNGGEASVEITGGNVTSISTSGELKDYTIKGVTYSSYIIEKGNGIGGGSSTNSTGGKGTVTITGGNVKANGIGGGNSTKALGGDAIVKIYDGTIAADSIGGGFSAKNGYAEGSVTVDGGSVNTTMAAVPTNTPKDFIYMTRIAVYEADGVTPAKNKQITQIYGKNIDSSSYKMDHAYTDDNGMIYLYIPADVVITGLGDASSGKYEALDEPDGEIASKEVGKVIMNKGREHYLVNIITSDFYDLYSDDNKLIPLSSAQFVEKNTIYTFYIDPKKDDNGNPYIVTPYYAAYDNEGNKVFNQGETNKLSNGLYSVSITVSTDTQVWFSILLNTETQESIFTLDLTNGNIVITQDPANENAIIIEQSGYKYTGFTGSIYLTSGGYPTSNTVTVNAPNRDVDLLVDKMVASAESSPFKLVSGDVTLTSTNKNDYIISTGGAAITVEEDASLKIYMDEDDSLKIYGANNKPAIEGKGSVNIVDYGGFLLLNETTNTSSQLVVGTYLYESNTTGKMPYTAELFVGMFKFELIGYVKDNLLYDKNESLTGNKENFSARGIYEVYSPETVVKSSNKQVTDDRDYSLTIKSSSGELEAPVLAVYEANRVLINGSDYLWNYVDTSKTQISLTIKGSAFNEGNIIIYANTYGEIPFTSFDYNDQYDGYAHSIEVLVDTSRYKVYYYHEEITKDNFQSLLDAGLLLENPTEYIDVGNYVVYFFIIDTNTEQTKTSVGGSNNVIITKGTNIFENKLVCADVVLGNLPKPSITSKWGTPNYIYYDEYGNVTNDFSNEGIYYVTSYVDATINYDKIETDYRIKFKVFKTNVFAQLGSYFESINDLTQTIQVPGNGSFTVSYQFYSEASMYLMFEKSENSTYEALCVNTKVMMIEFSDNNIPVYYYYYVNNSDINEDDNNVYLSLTNFIKMGTTNDKYTFSIGEQTNLQFSVTLNETINKIIYVKLVNGFKVDLFENQKITVEISTPETASININSISNTVNNRMDVNFTINSLYNYQKVVTLSLFKKVGSEFVEYNIENMYLTLAGTNEAPKYYFGNKAIFNFKSGQANNLNYTVYFNNIPNGHYKVHAEIAIVTNEADDRYATSSFSDSKEYNYVNVDKSLLYVNEINDTRYLTNNYGSFTFTIESNISNIENINVEVLRRDVLTGSYSTFIANKTYDVSNNQFVIRVSNLTSGTYRFVFEIDGITCYYNIIVDLA